MILVIDVGTSSLRAAAVRRDGTLVHVERREITPASPAPGLVEFDPEELARIAIDAACEVIERVGPVHAVGIATQRASTIVWDRSTGVPVGPGLGWQDLRTVGECLMARAEHGIELAPNQTATKAAWLIAQADGDADRCIGTVDSWIVWNLTGGQRHVTDHTNAATTGLYGLHDGTWDARRCELLGLRVDWLPEVVDTAGYIADATALPGAPPIMSLVGDQQASLVGQGCVTPGLAKITFGTGAMLDLCTGSVGPTTASRGSHGTFPIVAWSHAGERRWAVEAIMLSAGTAVEWLVDDLGLVPDAAATTELAASCTDSGGVLFVPALLGLGTPNWDYGARGTLLGMTRGTTAAHVVRAVLEGVAHRGADLIEAAAADTGSTVSVIRVDGGMSQNPTFVGALADASGCTVEVSPVVEATTVGAAHLASVALGDWGAVTDTAAAWVPAARFEPRTDSAVARDRARWRSAVDRAAAWIPELSALDF